MERRTFLGSLAASLAAWSWRSGRADATSTGAQGEAGEDEWREVRKRFALDRDHVHLAGLLIASHPAPVSRAIRAHRDALDRNPAEHLLEENVAELARSRNAAARYTGADAAGIALTDSTTTGLAMIYNGIAIRPDQEFLTTEHDYYATHRALEFRSRRSGAAVRTTRLYGKSAEADAGTMAERLLEAVGPRTRVLALTWVHSGTGVKLPVRAIADGVAKRNAGRRPGERILVCVDGVHGLGVEDVDVPELGCDFFAAGTHKWMFAPRGTGILWGKANAREFLTPTIPTFGWHDVGWGSIMTPGGFKAFEHWWAMGEAFEFHRSLGRSRVSRRLHALNRILLEGLAGMPHVTLHTPLDPAVSSALACFEVRGMSPHAVVSALGKRRIIASTTPYSPSYARLSPAIFNTEQEMRTALDAIAALRR